MTDTFTSDSGVKYDIVEEEGSRTYPTGRVYLQKSSQSPDENKSKYAPKSLEEIYKTVINDPWNKDIISDIMDGYARNPSNSNKRLSKMELLLMKRWNLGPETQEESPTKTESEKQDFGKKLLDYIRNEYDSDIRTSTEIFPKLEKIEGCHGTCCNCSTCNYPNDECVCSHNRLITFLSSNGYL